MADCVAVGEGPTPRTSFALTAPVALVDLPGPLGALLHLLAIFRAAILTATQEVVVIDRRTVTRFTPENPDAVHDRFETIRARTITHLQEAVETLRHEAAQDSTGSPWRKSKITP